MGALGGGGGGGTMGVRWRGVTLGGGLVTMVGGGGGLFVRNWSKMRVFGPFLEKYYILAAPG